MRKSNKIGDWMVWRWWKKELSLVLNLEIEGMSDARVIFRLDLMVIEVSRIKC